MGVMAFFVEGRMLGAGSFVDMLWAAHESVTLHCSTVKCLLGANCGYQSGGPGLPGLTCHSAILTIATWLGVHIINDPCV